MAKKLNAAIILKELWIAVRKYVAIGAAIIGGLVAKQLVHELMHPPKPLIRKTSRIARVPLLASCSHGSAGFDFGTRAFVPLTVAHHHWYSQGV